MLDDDSTVSRDAFAHAVRETTDGVLLRSDHHPLRGYTPIAFRHYVRRLALFDVMKQLDFRTALDVGCAEGYFMSEIRDSFGAEVWGVDISPVAVAKAHERWDVPVAAADAKRLPFRDNSFDIVYSTEVIEHVLDPELMLAELKRVARHTVLVTTPVSQSADEHEPDFDLRSEGHVHNFDPATVRRVFGPNATLRSFRCNATLSLIVAAGRYMPAGIRDAFYGLDHAVSQRLGSPTRAFKPLRNRDWLITVPATAGASAEPGFICPACHGELAEQGAQLRCTGCGTLYDAPDGVPDFFDAASAATH